MDSPDPNGTAAGQPAPAAARSPAWVARLGWWVLLPLLVATLLVVGGSAAGLRWLLTTESGAQWLLARTPGVQAEGVRGALLGPELQAARLSFPAGAHRVTIEGLQASGLHWRWHPQPGVWLALDAQSVAARRVVLRRGPPSPPPTTLEFPFQLALQRLQIDRFELDDQPAVQAIEAQGLRLDSAGSGTHGVQALSLRVQGHALSGQAVIGAAAPLMLQAQLELQPVPAAPAASAAASQAAPPPPAWTAQLRAQGPLQELDVQASLRAAPAPGSRPGAATPGLELQARVTPFTAWPLGTLQLQTEALDLSALAPGAPQTALTGRADVQAGAADAPITATVALRNALPGRWNEGRLPLRTLALELQGSLQTRDRLDVQRFELELGDTGGSGGRWSGSGAWQGHGLSVDTRLQNVQPQRLDGRAAAMQLTGPLRLQVQGLPALGPPASGSTPGGTASAPVRPPWSGQLELLLDGRLEGAPSPVQLKLRARGDAQRLQVEQARLQSGPAVAELKASLRRQNVPAGPGGRRSVPGWRLETDGSLLDFDPVPWWPGEAGSAWRQSTNRLSAGWNFDLRLPHSALRQAPLAALQRVAGNGSLRLHDAVLASVPLRGELSLAYGAEVAGSGALLRQLLPAGAAPAAAQASAPAAGTIAGTSTTVGTDGSQALGRLQADLRIGGNQVQLAAQGDPLGEGDEDRWALQVQAGLLRNLAPLARLHPALADWVPRQGELQLQLDGEGRWPRLRTQGRAEVQALAMGPLTLDAAQATWRLDSRAGDPQRSLELLARVDGLQRGDLRLAQLQAVANGTLAQHRISLDAAISQAPPAWLEQLLAVPRRQGTRALLRAEGGWTSNAEGGGTWRARVERLAALAWSGPQTSAAEGGSRAATALRARGLVGLPPSGPAWAEALALQAELGFDSSGQLVRASAEPGQLRLGDVAALRWERVRVDLSGARPQLSLRAELAPLDLAPLLARALPDMGWGGDLRVGAQARIEAGERFEAELLLERLGGDLHLKDGNGLQLLGLTDLRLGLVARDGVWNFRQAFVGRSVGQLGTNLRVRTSPQSRWPEPDAPVEGQIEARVNDIGVWGNWVPPGWRLTGAVNTQAQVSGRFGAPRFTGRLSGSGLGVRNLLQGVNVTDGQIRLSLDGDSARIETFTLRGGDGQLDITGGATLGQAPQAELAVRAEAFRVLGRVDRQLVTSGQAQLRLQRDLIKLDGRLRVDEGLFDASRADAPSLDNDVSIRQAGGATLPEAEVKVARADPRLVVSLDVELGERLRVRGRGLDTDLRGQLRLTTPGGRLAVNGSVRTEQGTYAAYGQKLEIERGIVAFAGPADNPRLDVLALRPNADIRVGVAITGTLQALRVRLYADPEMGETDKLSWLVLGRAPDGLGRTDSALLQRAAVALLAGEGEGPTDELLRNLGIDDLSLRQDEGDTRQTVITLGKQLSRRWYLGYERGVNATTGTWQLIYRVAQRLTVRMQSGLENSLDIIWVWRVGEVPETPVPKSDAQAPPAPGTAPTPRSP
jgi:translocation and assembly module TamB